MTTKDMEKEALPIDLSSLDPCRDEKRWEGLVHSVVSRAMERRRQRESQWSRLLSWARPAFALAAVLALLTWAVTLVKTFPQKPERQRDESVFTLAGWAARGEYPSTSKFLYVMEQAQRAETKSSNQGREGITP